METQQKKPFISGLVESQVDSQIYHDILKTHARETITLFDYGNMAITGVDQKTLGRVQFTECELSPFRKHEICCDTKDDRDFERKASLPRFSEKKMDLKDIQKLLVHSFSPDESGHRPYPSAGGLYPVEPLVFLFEDRIIHPESILSGCYQFRPVSKSLQLIKKCIADDFFEEQLHGLVENKCRPCFAIFYITHIGKAIFKYRYRGYRHAVMEAGSMYQQATHISQQMDIRTTVWSSFSDHQLLHAVGLDHSTYLPLTMQFFGYGE